MDIEGPGPAGQSRMAGRTPSIQEAENLAKRYEAEGFTATIKRIRQAGLTLYEVWISKKPDIFSLE
jgi:hypothetical protein